MFDLVFFLGGTVVALWLFAIFVDKIFDKEKPEAEQKN